MEKAEIEGLWTHIHWLSVLEEQGTYTAAAARLGVSKSAVSQRISDLEKATGTRLVTRTTRSVRLTDAGLSLTREVRGAYEQIARSFSSVRDSTGEIRGLVRLTAPVAFARQQLVPHLSEFLQQYPQVRIQLDVSDALSSLAAEGYDLAVRHGFQVPETHVAWKLCDTGSVLVATRDYLQRHGEPREPGDLVEPFDTDGPSQRISRELGSRLGPGFAQCHGLAHIHFNGPPIVLRGCEHAQFAIALNEPECGGHDADAYARVPCFQALQRGDRYPHALRPGLE